MPVSRNANARTSLSWAHRAILATVSMLVLGVYIAAAHSGFWESLTPAASENYYNRLVDGFRAGQLNLKKDVPPGLAQLADPYDPVANAHYRGAFYQLHDLSYYKGRLYLYFGITPALILFWPAAALTGQYVLYRQAALFFCALGYLASLGVLTSIWRRCFSEVNVWVLAAGALVLGLASGIPVLLVRCSVYEVPISCGYMLTMFTLGAIWRALLDPTRKLRWVIAASTAYGLALGARPSLLPGAVILFVPLIWDWPQRKSVWPLLGASVVPIMLLGIGLMVYNALRFSSPLEFGLHYQLTSGYQMTQELFSPRYIWFNFRSYFLHPARWSGHFPFVNAATPPFMPSGHGAAESPFAILLNVPLVWLALAVPLAWHARREPTCSRLIWFLTSMILLVVISTATLLCYYTACVRYQMEFLPELSLLAMIGIFGLEQRLAHRTVWRLWVRGGWCLLLGLSVMFNLLSSVEHYAESKHDLGMTFMELGKMTEAGQRFAEAVRLDPDYAAGHNDLGLALEEMGRIDDATEQFRQAVRLDPGLIAARYNLANALVRSHKVDEAIHEYQEVLRLQPKDREAHFDVGEICFSLGRIQEAVEQYQEALRIDPNYAEAHERLGNALARTGDIKGAAAHFTEALRLQPNSAEAHSGLANVLMIEGDVEEAIGQYQQALRIAPDSATTHYNLGVALERAGRVPEAVEQYARASDLKPDLATAVEALHRLRRD